MSGWLLIEVQLVAVQILKHDAGAMRHRLRLAFKRHPARSHREKVPPTVVSGESEQRRASSLLPDQRTLFGRLRELEVDGHIRSSWRTDQKPPVLTHPEILRDNETELIDKKPKGQFLIVHEQRKYREAHRHSLLLAGE